MTQPDHKLLDDFKDWLMFWYGSHDEEEQKSKILGPAQVDEFIRDKEIVGPEAVRCRGVLLDLLQRAAGRGQS